VEEYQFKPSDIPVALEIGSEVGMIHEGINKSPWMFGSRPHPNERHDILVPETTSCKSFFAVSLFGKLSVDRTRGRCRCGTYRVVW